MPVTYLIEGDVLRMDLVGEYEPEHVTAAFLAAIADPACPDPVRLLVDVSRSKVIETRGEYQIRHVSMFLRPHAERIGGSCTLVVGSDTQFEIGLRGSVYTHGVGVEARVFRNSDTALEWLGKRAEKAPE